MLKALAFRLPLFLSRAGLSLIGWRFALDFMVASITKLSCE